jgi:hypothetical protein
MTKLKAAAIHLTISLFVIGVFLSVVFFIWYPQPLFTFARVIEPLKLLILVDVIIGPILTFIVYKKYKKSLKFDLSIIALLQIVALSYGVQTIYNGRSSLIAMYAGEFHYLIEKYADNGKLKYQQLQPSVFSKPKIVYVSNLANMDLYNSYNLFEPVTDFNLMVLPHALSLDNMRARFSAKVEEINALEEKYKEDDIVFFVFNKDDFRWYVVFSQKSNSIIDYLKL